MQRQGQEKTTLPHTLESRKLTVLAHVNPLPRPSASLAISRRAPEANAVLPDELRVVPCIHAKLAPGVIVKIDLIVPFLDGAVDGCVADSEVLPVGRVAVNEGAPLPGELVRQDLGAGGNVGGPSLRGNTVKCAQLVVLAQAGLPRCRWGRNGWWAARWSRRSLGCWISWWWSPWGARWWAWCWRSGWTRWWQWWHGGGRSSPAGWRGWHRWSLVSAPGPRIGVGSAHSATHLGKTLRSLATHLFDSPFAIAYGSRSPVSRPLVPLRHPAVAPSRRRVVMIGIGDLGEDGEDQDQGKRPNHDRRSHGGGPSRSSPPSSTAAAQRVASRASRSRRRWSRSFGAGRRRRATF